MRREQFVVAVRTHGVSQLTALGGAPPDAGTASIVVAGCSEMEIATLTGHSSQDVHAILDAHYLNRDPALPESAHSEARKRNKSSKLIS